MYWRKTFFRFLSLLLAANYFSFRVECFDGEFEAHGPRPQGTAAFNMPSLDWETFDKNNAPEAVTVEMTLRLELCVPLRQERTVRVRTAAALERIRDKSPPSLSSLS